MQDLSFVPFHIADIFDDINDEYWVYETLFKDVINEHAPLKTRRIKHNNYDSLHELSLEKGN